MGVPAVSVIIPLYNAEKYVAECLTGILSQTFQDFEVIIVDDCSTDKSVEVVESCREQFGERLKLAQTETNSGSGNLPRNIGLSMASGDYVFFMDADNFILPTALETLHAAAKENDADVVYTAACYDLRKPDDVRVLRDGKGKNALKTDVDAEPKLIKDAPEKNLQKLFAESDFRNAWAKFVRRDLLTKNEIFFPTITTDGDYIWSVNVYCHAKRFLRLPTPLYFYRSYSAGRAARKKRKPAEQISYWVSAFVAWLKALNALTNKIEILRENPSWSYQASLEHLKYCLNQMSDEVLNRFYSKETYEILLREFADEKASLDLIVPFFFSVLANREKLVNKTQKRVTKLEDETAQQKKQIKSMSAYICPAVSVIIPMYNAEKYVGDCLDSILAQTLQNFEVIVIDDCSTDSSRKIIESYIPKFDGRLVLSKTEKTSGSGGIPRNIGVTLSRGEYLYFIDADDAITKTALEEMYTLAKKFDADAVYCERYFMSSDTGKNFTKKIYPAVGKIQDPPFVDKPTLETTDLAIRIQKLIKNNYWVTTWLRLVRRKLLIENKITFSTAIYSEDTMWTYQVLFCAKRFLRIPNACYIRRMHDDSLTRRKYSAKEYMYNWMSAIVLSFKDFDDFMGKIDFFKKNPHRRYEVLDNFFQSKCMTSFRECKNFSAADVYKLFCQNFEEDLGDYTALVSTFYARIYAQSKYWNAKYDKLKNESQRKIDELEKEIRHLQRECDALKNDAAQINRPAVSVVIPLYNAEKYIGECLTSLLIQTFQDFEVIVVDDCSTDKSVKIVEDYAPKFDGLLTLARTEKNSGSGGSVPRNIGLKLSRGEYVYFMDADDFILGSALETFHTAAKEHDADIVYTSAYYLLNRPNGAHTLKDGTGKTLLEAGIDDAPTLTVNDPGKNLENLVFERGFNFPWTQFVRRELLIRNEIRFPEIVNGVDHLWVIQVYCYAQRFLRIPAPLYFYRRYDMNSISTKKRPPREQVSYWISTFVTWLKTLNEIANKIEILRNNPAYCFEAAKRHFEWCLNRTGEARKKLSNQDIYEILYNEFSRGNVSADLTVPFFFSFINTAEKVNKDNLQVIDELQTEVNRFKDLQESSADKIQSVNEE